MKKTVVFVSLIFLSVVGMANSDPNFFENTPKPKISKTTVLQISPKENNPRNSEGDFIKLKNGKILFVYSHYTGNSSDDHATAYLASRFSTDEGKTWSQEDQLVVEQEGKMNVMSVSLLRLKNGQIALFYLKKNSTADCIPMVRFSTDEAVSWSDPKPCITDKNGYFVLNNNRVIQLKSGRLIFAVALHQTPESKWSNIGKLFSYYSDDFGKTWISSSEVPNNEGVTTQEPGLIELKNGQIMMIIRANKGFQHQSFSEDKGKTWSAVPATKISSPLSPATITRLPKTKDLVMVWNDNDGQNPTLKGKRTPQNIAISKDEGQSWENNKILEDDPDGWYCYTAILAEKKYILLSYCAGSQLKKTHLSQTNIVRISLEDIYKK